MYILKKKNSCKAVCHEDDVVVGCVTFLSFPIKCSSQKTCCTHPLRRRRGGTRRSVSFRVPTLTLWMWNVQVPPYTATLVRSGKTFGIVNLTHLVVFFLALVRLLQDHDGVQPRSDSGAVCGLLNSPVSAYRRQSTSHRGSVSNPSHWCSSFGLSAFCTPLDGILSSRILSAARAVRSVALEQSGCDPQFRVVDRQSCT